jgi:hypothetical protein
MIRKITSKHDEEKKRRRNQIIVGLVLVFVMLLSTLGYSFGSNTSSGSSPTINYNGYEFTYLNGLWNLDSGGQTFNFISNPSIAYKLNFSIKPLADYQGKTLYLYSENLGAESEIYQNMQNVALSVPPACPENEENCGKGIPVKTCADNFIIIREKNETNILQKDDCLFIEGPAEDLVRITDGVLLRIIGVQ